jgi:hypothetical protein
MPARFFWFQLFYWLCIAIFCVLLLRIRDRRGRVSVALLLALVTMVAVFFGGLAIAMRLSK